MTAHLAVLAAAQRLCAERQEPVFTPEEIVRALPAVNASTVRTHVTSRCCVNAPSHHQSRPEYFRRIDRGRYELLPRYRTSRTKTVLPPRPRRALTSPQRDTIHAIITKEGGTYTVDCHEVAVVTQGRTLDEALANLLEAVGLHLEGEDLAGLGLDGVKRIHVSVQSAGDARCGLSSCPGVMLPQHSVNSASKWCRRVEVMPSCVERWPVNDRR